MTRVSADQVTDIRRDVAAKLRQHALPDSRLHYTFDDVPNFRNSTAAIDRILNLPCYRSAGALLIMPDNSLEGLRCQALKDGKKVVVATHKLRRGFVLLDPHRIREDRFELASCLDGMEKPGIGRQITLAQMQEEGIRLDMFVSGVMAVTEQGVQIIRNRHFVEPQWAMLVDRNIMDKLAPVIIVAHDCQVIDEEDECVKSDVLPCYVQADFLVTPERLLKIEGAAKPLPEFQTTNNIYIEDLRDVPPAQELIGIKMAEEVMRKHGFPGEKQKSSASMPTAEEQMGIDMVEKLMKGYRA